MEIVDSMDSLMKKYIPNKRIIWLTGQKLRYFFVDEFNDPKFVNSIIADLPGKDVYEEERIKLMANRAKVVPEMRLFYDLPLYTIEQEQHQFRKFSYLKYKLEIALTHAYEESYSDEILNLDKQIGELRNHIISANCRLVLKIAQRQKHYYQNKRLDVLADIINDGILALAKATEYYDFRKPNKFSTYATWVILDMMVKVYKEKVKHEVVVHRFEDEIFEKPVMEVEEEENFSLPYSITELLGYLNKRNREVIVNYYGLRTGLPKRLRDVAKEMGVSPERIRQLREDGINKIRSILGITNG